MKKISTKALVQIALLIALDIILTRFLRIQTPTLRISFGFLPIAIIAMLHGPMLAGIAGALGDLIGFMLVPVGTFFPGFTLSAILTGVIYGVFLYDRPKSLGRIVMIALTMTVCITLVLNTFWLSILFEDAFVVLLLPRFILAGIMFTLQVVCIRFAASERFYSLFGGKPAPATTAD